MFGFMGNMLDAKAMESAYDEEGRLKKPWTDRMIKMQQATTGPGIDDLTALEAVKNDAGKDPWHLAPWDAFRAVVKVMAFGASKYAPRNWEKGFDYSRLYRASIEHLSSWWEGQDLDPETRYSHLWHAGCCVLFLISHELRGIGNDDRPKHIGKDV